MRLTVRIGIVVCFLGSVNRSFRRRVFHRWLPVVRVNVTSPRAPPTPSVKPLESASRRLKQRCVCPSVCHPPVCRVHMFWMVCMQFFWVMIRGIGVREKSIQHPCMHCECEHECVLFSVVRVVLRVSKDTAAPGEAAAVTERAP